MLRLMSRGQWVRWKAYFELEPFGPVQEDLRAGYVAMLTHNANCKPGKEKRPSDFFPSLRIPERKQTAQDVRLEQIRWKSLADAQRR
jgi:hypothetical protein